MDRITQAALAKIKADRQYTEAFEVFFCGLEPLTDDEFHKIAKKYCEALVEFRFILGRSNAIEQAAWEIFRKSLCGDEGYDGNMMLRFAKTYSMMKERLYRPLFDIVKNKGDDSYGDLLDNLVLLGGNLFQKMESKHWGNESALKDAVKKTADKIFHTSTSLAFVWDGENYHSLSLNEASRKYVVAITRSKEQQLALAGPKQRAEEVV